MARTPLLKVPMRTLLPSTLSQVTPSTEFAFIVTLRPSAARRAGPRRAHAPQARVKIAETRIILSTRRTESDFQNGRVQHLEKLRPLWPSPHNSSAHTGHLRSSPRPHMHTPLGAAGVFLPQPTIEFTERTATGAAQRISGLPLRSASGST